MNTTTEPVIPSVASKIHKIHVGNFGNGRYSPAMEEVYKDTQRLFGLTDIQAHIVAAQVGRDAGQLNNAKVSKLKVSSASKDGKVGLKEVVDAVKVTSTFALTICHLCAELDKLRKAGLLIGSEEGAAFANLRPNIQKWIEEATENVEAMSVQEIAAANK